MRNLDITTLRSFAAVAETGGVTRAAGFLHLTQSAVSMQLKRLEEMLGIALLDRSGRQVALTAEGEQLLVYARRMVALNDEIVRRLTDDTFEGELTVGVPHDIVYPHVPMVLKQFNAAFPRVRVQLLSSFTTALRAQFDRGEVDIILTTETHTAEEAVTLVDMPLVWVGAPGGSAWRQQPLPLAFARQCAFRPLALGALDAQGQDWVMAVDSESDRTIEATMSADLAISAVISGTQPPHLAEIAHGGVLPDLPRQRINMFVNKQGDAIHDAMAELMRAAFAGETGLRVAAG